MSWKVFFADYKVKTLFVILFFIITLFFTFIVLNYVESRQGAVLNDPILNAIPSEDVSYLLFFITYVGSIVGIIYSLRTPYRMVRAMLTYSLLLWLRLICMYLTPLNPPDGIVPLRDPFLEATFYANQVNLKDLFFSGHTATMFMFFLLIDYKWLKYLFFVSTLAVAALVLIQHAHYSIDVFVAPVAAYTAYRMAIFITKKYFFADTKLNELF